MVQTTRNFELFNKKTKTKTKTKTNGVFKIFEDVFVDETIV